MKAPDFDYLRPADLDTAISYLSEHKGEALPLAGGQSLMPMMNFRIVSPSALIDLADIADLRGISRKGDVLRIGAMTRYVDLINDPAVGRSIPLFEMALPHIAHDAIRNRGTIGGSLALADPAAEMPALALALDARIEVIGPKQSRMIPADEFFSGWYETTLADDELVVAIHIPEATGKQRFGFYELVQRHGDYALAGVAVARTENAHRIAFFGVADRALRVPSVESELDSGGDLKSAMDHLSAITFTNDQKANAVTRRRFAEVALMRAMEGI